MIILVFVLIYLPYRHKVIIILEIFLEVTINIDQLAVNKSLGKCESWICTDLIPPVTVMHH